MFGGFGGSESFGWQGNLGDLKVNWENFVNSDNYINWVNWII